MGSNPDGHSPEHDPGACLHRANRVWTICADVGHDSHRHRCDLSTPDVL